MHHHLFGLGTLALVGGLIAAPHVISAVRDMTDAPPAAHGSAGAPSDARALLSSALDSTLAAGRSGRIDQSLDAFSSTLQRQAHVSDRDVDAVLSTARGPESQAFLRNLAAAVRHPGNVSAQGTGLDPNDRDLIARVARSVRESVQNR